MKSDLKSTVRQNDQSNIHTEKMLNGYARIQQNQVDMIKTKQDKITTNKADITRQKNLVIFLPKKIIIHFVFYSLQLAFTISKLLYTMHIDTMLPLGHQ